MVMPYFVADSAQVTVMRRLASSSFGRYQLKVPDGMNIDDIHKFSAPGNELGYVAALSGRRVGGFARRMMRADIAVTAANPSDPGWVTESNVDAVLREAESRTAGDFFLESDISIAGLGSWRPFVDFQVGDLANVEIWGRVVQLKITRIENRATDHNDMDWIVHVGGQLVSDEQARLAENEDIHRQLMEDQRDLAGVEAQAAKAVAEAESAKAAADGVKEFLTGSDAVTLFDSLRDINAQLQEQGEVSKPGLVPAYLDLNTRLWAQQATINAQQQKINRQQEAINSAQQELWAVQKSFNEQVDKTYAQLVEMQSKLAIPKRGIVFAYMGEAVTDGPVRIDTSGSKIIFSNTTPVNAVIHWTYKDGSVFTPRGAKRKPGDPSEFKLLTRAGGVTGGYLDYARVDYEIVPGVQKMTTLGFDFPKVGNWYRLTNSIYDKWVTIASFTAPVDSNYLLTYSANLVQASRGLLYGIRVLCNGQPVKTEESREIGPTTWFGSGSARINLMAEIIAMKGQRIEVQAITEADPTWPYESDFLDSTDPASGVLHYIDNG